MAESSWIKMRTNLTTDPRVVEIAATVGVDEFGVVGRLHTVWSWLDQHSIDGTNVRITSAFLDRLTACSGFADAMRTVSWLAGRDGALEFPGYGKHNGTTAKSRAVEAKRKAEQRERDKRPDIDSDRRPDCSGINVPSASGPEKIRGDKNRGEEGAPPPPPRAMKKAGPESEEAWLSSLQDTYPGINVRAELDEARKYRRKKGKRLERGWFEDQWLARCSAEVGSNEPGNVAGPDGWQKWLITRYPSCTVPDTFAELPKEIRIEVHEALGNRGKAA